MSIKFWRYTLFNLSLMITHIAIAAEYTSWIAPISPPIPPKLAIASNEFQKMQALRATGDLDKAIKLGKKYLEVHPEDADVSLLVGLIFYQKHDFSNATTYLNKALDSSPTYLDAKLGLISIAIAQKNFGQAEILISAVKNQAPSDARVCAIQSFFKKIQKQNQETVMRYPSHLVPLVMNPPPIKTEPYPLKEMQTLREKGAVNKAISLGEAYIKKHPKDGDILLLIGLSFYQNKNFPMATFYLKQALVIAPNDLDITLGLINLAIAQKNYKWAARLLAEAHIQAPNNASVKTAQERFKNIQYQNKITIITDYYQKNNLLQAKIKAVQLLASNPEDLTARLLLGNIYLSLKDYPRAKKEYKRLLFQNPKNKKVRLALINVELVAGHDRIARSLVGQSLVLFPNDHDFLADRARIYAISHQYAVAADLDSKIKEGDPKNKAAVAQLEEIQKLNPHFLYGVNEVGANTEVDYISDLRSYWEYSTFYYNRDTSWGSFALNLNNAYRFGTNANQGVVSLSPVVSKNLYFKVTGGYANEPVLFPTYTTGIEGYFSGVPVELSAGYTYASILPSIAYSQYTASVSKELDKYWISFRPNFYRPIHGKNSILYTATLIRYLGPKDTYARIMLGSGTSPDLANLTTTNFIVIKNNFVTCSLQFPVINHSFLLSIGGDYQHWVFPSTNLVRNISGATVGLNYRFKV